MFDDQKYRRQREDRKKGANRIVKEEIRKRKNRMWEIKYRWHNWGLTIGRIMTFFREFAE